MPTRFYLSRFMVAMLLCGTVIFACSWPKAGQAQEARTGTPSVQASASSAAVLAPDQLTPCQRLIPARTKLYGVLAGSTEPCFYSFPGVSGEVITIHATSVDQAATPTIRLLAPQGAELTAGTVTSGTQGALIYGYRLTETGLHTIMVATAEAAASSQFRLAVAGNTRCGGKLTPETVVAAQLAANARYCVYSIAGEANSLWQVETHKLDGGIAPEVELFDPQGIRLDGHTTPGLSTPAAAPLRTYQLPVAGVYSLLVNAARMVDVGSFELVLWPASVPTMEPLSEASFGLGQQVRNVYALSDNRVNLRRTPGHLNKPANDVLLNLPGAATMTILGSAVTKDQLSWWPVLYAAADNRLYTGWVAAATDTGQTILGSD